MKFIHPFLLNFVCERVDGSSVDKDTVFCEHFMSMSLSSNHRHDLMCQLNCNILATKIHNATYIACVLLHYYARRITSI